MDYDMELKSTQITELYQKYVAMIYRICFVLLKNESDTEDAVQAVFMKVLEKEMTFHNPDHEKAWLIVTAQNHCKNQLKHWWRKNIEFESNQHDSTYESETNDILELVLQLPDKFKMPIYLYYYEGYQTDEIAEILSLNTSTLRSRLKKGRELLKLEMGGEPHE